MPSINIESFQLSEHIHPMHQSTMDGRDMLNSVFCDELLAEILCRVRDPLDSESISLVCKRWQKVQRNAKSTLGFCMPSDAMSAATFCASVPSLLAQHPYISSLSIKAKSHVAAAEPLTACVVAAVAFCCKSLKHFHFTAGPVTVSSLQELSKGCPGLISLEILQPPAASCLPILSEFKSLQELCLRGYPEGMVCADDGVDVQGSSVYGSLQLTKLCLINMRSCSACDLRWLWRSCCRLQKLELSHCEGVGDTMSAFMHCMPSLRELKLHRCRAIAGEVLALISEHSPELRALTVHDGADTQGLRQVLQRCRALELLDLRLPLDLSNEDLMEIAQSGRLLRCLRLHSCWLATGADMRSLASNITSDLEELVLVRCRAIVQDPGTLSALGQSLPNLKNIDLSGNEYLADKELAAMLASCTSVRHLKLWKCRRLTDMVVNFIGQRCLMLESIDIRSCEEISAKAVTSLLISCGRLKAVAIEPNKLSKTTKTLAFLKGIAFEGASCLARDGSDRVNLAYQNI